MSLDHRDRWEEWHRVAEQLERDDPERWLPGRFAPPPGLYFDGNSLGLMSRRVGAAVEQVLREWRLLGVMGWNHADPPWFEQVEKVAARLAPLIGADPGQVTLGASTTVELHQLLATFYRPTARRFRMLVDGEAFPTDRYAVASHLALHGRDPVRDLVVVPANAEHILDPDRIIQALTDDVAVAVLPSVVYTTGQRLDMARITQHAHRQGVFVIWDLSHSAGLFPHRVVAEHIDAAVFCTYKYLHGGPGSPAGVYVHPRHLPVRPGLAGWWGSDKAHQFAMPDRLVPAADAGALQLGTPSPLALAPLTAVVSIFEEVGIEALWDRSQRLMGLLDALAAEALEPRGFHVLKPPARGGHMALTHPRALPLSLVLRARRVIVDFRPPDMLRVAPAPLTTRPADVVELVRALAEAADDQDALLDPVDVPPVV
jgi:kynureninase